MSRRKQSNPKPLKRKSEDVLEEVAELHHLPQHILSLRDPEDESLEYTVFSKSNLREGYLFGPYTASLLSEREDNNIKHNSHNVIQVRCSKDNEVLIQLLDETGGWLKLIRQASGHDEANVSLTLDGSELWCTVKNRIEPNTELLMTCQILDYGTSLPSSPPHSYNSSHRIHADMFTDHRSASNSSSPTAETQLHGHLSHHHDNVGEHENAAARRSGSVSDTNEKNLSRKKEESSKNAASCGSVVKYEPSSPSSPPSATSPPSDTLSDSFHASSACSAPPGGQIPYMNGFRYATAFNYAMNVGSTADGNYQCNACEIRFSSPRTLQIHQIYYCSHKLNASMSDTDTDEANSYHRPADQETTESCRQADSPLSDAGNTKSTKENESLSKSPGEHHVDGETGLKPNGAPSGSVNSGSGISKSPRIFRCPYCKYASDKKASVTRHVRMHGSSPTTDSPGELPISIPPVARYCANCDIQFASYKNYQVHKQFYCSTRHVHKSATSGTGNQQSSSQALVQSSSPDKTNEMPSQDVATNPYGMMLNQPLYAAISTSPLILVPCSYVPGGGITPAAGLIPSGSIIIPNTPPALSPGDGNSSDSHNIIPNYAIMPGSKPAVSSSVEDKTEAKSSPPPDVPNTKKCDSESAENKSVVGPSPAKDEPEKPLDLSLRKISEKDSRPVNEKSISQPSSSRPVSAGSTTSCQNESLNINPGTMPNLPGSTSQNLAVEVTATAASKCIPIPPTAVPPALVMDPRNACLTPLVAQPTPQVLVKQGTSKCKECNIVFYKHENYLVHKSLYCASRLQKLQDSPQDSGKTVPEEQAADKEDIGPRCTNSPIISQPVTPESVEAPPNNNNNNAVTSPKNQSNVLQFFCMACGIKFTSMDNLTAHQTYYCPKRENANVQPIAMLPTAMRGEYRCSKCKNSYPTEESLKNHPCALQRKCPYCDVYCPTLSAAQRHLVTHTGVKSFRCSLCGYKGHTLRGMRTHIRIHLDKNNTTPEEAYILCVDEGGAEIGSVNRKNSRNAVTDRLALVTDSMHNDSVAVGPAGIPANEVTVNRKGMPDIVSDQVFSGDVTHWCQICGYSSSYKGNVVRHVKLVHKELMSTQSMTSIVNSKPNLTPAHENKSQVIEVVEPMDVGKTKPSVDSMDIPKPIMNGTSSSAIDVSGKVKCEVPPGVPIKTESLSPPPVSSTARTIKRSLSVEGQSVTSSGSMSASVNKMGPKYCKACDISFNYLSNFIAHKKFYCTPRPGDGPAQEAGSVQSVQ